MVDRQLTGLTDSLSYVSELSNRDCSYKAEMCANVYLGITLCTMADMPIMPIIPSVVMTVAMIVVDGCDGWQ